MKVQLKTISKTDKILYSIFLITTIIIMLFCFIKPSIYSFALISVAANFFLILILRETLKLLKVRFTKKEKIIIISSIIAIYIFYIISILTRQFIYYSDFSCYYNIQLETEEKFASGLLKGIRFFGGTTWSGEYGNFLSFFPEIIFSFTNKTTNSFILSYILVYTPYIIVALSAIIKKIIEHLKIKKENQFFVMGILSFLLFPLYHATAIYGQPDFFGLLFVFLIIALTLKYDFKKIEINRLILLFLSAFMLTITRRWYIYWMLTYFICYIIKILITKLKCKEDLKIILKNIIIYGFIVALLFIITLLPMIKNILFGSIGDYSTFYLNGGFPSEVKTQISHLGYAIIIIMLTGIIYGLKTKKLRLSTILSIMQYFLTIFLFTRIQNMGYHHSLILVPIYLYWQYLFIYLIINITKELSIRYFILFIGLLTLNFSYGIMKNTTDNLFTKVPLTVENEQNYDEFISVANWLQENLNFSETAYMISHTSRYNPAKFRNVFMPDKTIYNYLPYGSAVIGTHYFPLELFNAKYILTTEPFEYISMEYKYNDVFKKLVLEGKFKQVKVFNMNNGFHILIYERIMPVDENEINLYLVALEEESKQFPELYKNVILNYKKLLQQ